MVPHRYAMRLAGVSQFNNMMNVHIMTTIEHKGRSGCKKSWLANMRAKRMWPGTDKNTKCDAVCCSHVKSNPVVVTCIPKRNESRHAVGVPHRHCYVAPRGTRTRIVVCHARHADSFSFELRSNVLLSKSRTTDHRRHPVVGAYATALLLE